MSPQRQKKNKIILWKSIKLECDVHRRQFAKRWQRQKEISAFYIAKQMQPIIVYMCSEEKQVVLQKP